MNKAFFLALLATLVAPPLHAQVAPERWLPRQTGLPFNDTLSNNTPLAFGMAPGDAARALGAPIAYVSGRPGNEIYLAIRDVGGSGFFDRRDKLYLQFRSGRLTGWKGDWGRRWIWQ